MEIQTSVGTILTALYLRGLARHSVLLPRNSWPRVAGALRRRHGAIESASDALRSEGLWAEAVTLEDSELLRSAHSLIIQRLVLTPEHDAYPVRWLERLGEKAPPALWRRGPTLESELVPEQGWKGWMGVVGSRRVDDKALAFAYSVGQAAARLGFGVVSGGAIGCDSMATTGTVEALRTAGASDHVSSGAALTILPFGIEFANDFNALSVCGPRDGFSVSFAMERNALIYSASEFAVVVHARYQEGGTWAGARDALRRRLCPILVRDDGSQASKALIALGAVPIREPAELPFAALRFNKNQPSLKV